MAPRTYGVTPSNGTRHLSLADLRELVDDTADLPGDAVVRGQAAMVGQDFTNPAGLVLRGLVVEYDRGSRPQAGGKPS